MSSEPRPEQTGASPCTARGRRRRWLWLPVVALLGFGGAQLLPLAQSAAPSPSGSKKGGAPPIAVVATEATRGDVGVYLSGLGSVTPLTTITVHSLVTGQLVSVGYKEGEIVQKGQLLAQIDPRPFQAQLELAEGQLVRDLAQLKNAKLDLERYATLAGQDSIARQQYDTQTSLVHQLEGTVEADRGNVDTAKLNLVYAHITSPITARVGLQLVDPGNIVHTTDTNGLVVLTQLQPMSVIFAIAEDSLPPVMEKLRANDPMRVDAYNREATRLIATGRLLTADNQVDPTTGTVRLKAIFDNNDLALFPGQFVNARLLVSLERDKTLVPAAALQRGAQATFVYVVKPDHTASVRDVKTGPTEGNQVAVESGLAPGELVVVDGADRLREGSKVELRAQGGSGTSGSSTPGGGP